MRNPIEPVRQSVRHVMRKLAVYLDGATGGRLHPDTVTIAGLLMHVPIAILIGSGHYWLWAGILLIVFGLFDTLDGELARLQQRSSAGGMLLDASTDRFKEVLLYAGAAYFLAGTGEPRHAVWAVVACGASLSVSYVKAKGEAAVAGAGKEISHEKLNRIFKDGLLPFELRMALVVFGLLMNQLLAVIVVIAVLASFTAVQRLALISKHLRG